MKKIIFLFLIVYFLQLPAQTSKYFEKILNNDTSCVLNDFVYVGNDVYVLAGSKTTDESSVYISYCDKDANIIQENVIGNSSYAVVSYDLASCEDGFGLGGFTNAPGSRMFYIKTDANLQLQDSAIVGTLDYTNHANAICKAVDKGWLLAGEIQPYTGVSNPPTHPYLVRLDSLGHKLWDTIYYQYGFPYSFAVEIQPSKVNSNEYELLIVSNWSYFMGTIQLLRINDEGEILLAKTISYNQVEQLFALGMENTNDGGLMLYGKSYFYEPFVIDNDTILEHGMEYMGSFLIKLDADWQEEWHQLLKDCRSITAVTETDIGQFMVCSTAYDSYPIIMNYDQVGSRRWMRRYNDITSDCYLRFIEPTSDGAYLCVGGARRTNTAFNILFLKTNCMGLLTTPIAKFEIVSYDTLSHLMTFHNLSSFVYPDSLDGGHYLWNFGDGDTSSAIHPTHIYQQAGEYWVSLKAIVCNDTNQARIKVSTMPIKTPPKIAFDPTNNSFTLHGYNYVADYDILWYDVLGRLVRKIRLQPKQTIINMHDLPNGVYFCKVNNWTGKIIVNN